MKRHRLSVAMCTYNGARFLPEQLESIALQKRLPDELVVCDDRSRDETVEMVRRFARRVPFPIRLEVNPSNLGATKNFEKAIGLCQGEIIALADQDDIWHVEKLSRLADVLEHNERTGAVFSDAELIDADSESLGETLWNSFGFSSRRQAKFGDGQELRVLLKRSAVTGATMAFRSEFRELVLPIPSGHIHDCWIALLIASVSRLNAIATPLISYRKHAGQLIGSGNCDSLSQTIDITRHAGRDHYLTEVERFGEICERLCNCSAAFQPYPDALGLIREKINHRRTRGCLPSSKLLRFPLVIREIAARRYWLYSDGLGSVAKDLLV